MAATFSLGQAVVGLKIRMKNGTPKNTTVDLGNGIMAVLNSWPNGWKRKFQPSRIKLVFPRGTFNGQNNNPCYFILTQDPDETSSYLYIGWPQFVDTDDPEVRDIIDATIMELAGKLGIAAHAEAA